MNLLCVLSLGLTMSSATTAIGQQIPLPTVESVQAMSIEEALEQRRSIRDFSRDGLELKDVSQLLWAAQGITSNRGFRTAPSAGALYPLELYIVAGEVAELSPGAYRYRPDDHDLVLVASGDLRKRLASATRQAWVGRAPAILVIAGVYQRTKAKYGQRGRRYVHMEVGHAAQNVYLAATARGLGTALVGAFHDKEVKKVLNLPPDHEPLGVMPVGHKQ